MLKYCVIGANGKLGKNIAKKIEKNAFVAVVKTALTTCDNYTTDKKAAIQQAKVVIEVSTVESCLESLELCVQSGTAIVIGVTGFTEQQLKKINERRDEIPILLASNFSYLVNVLQTALEKISANLAQTRADVDIIEWHRREKKDSPSGTAKDLENSILNYSKYRPENINIHSIRAGEAKGSHEVCFSLANESLMLKHTTLDRSNYAEGAIKAADWLQKQKPGLYTMQNIFS